MRDTLLSFICATGICSIAMVYGRDFESIVGLFGFVITIIGAIYTLISKKTGRDDVSKIINEIKESNERNDKNFDKMISEMRENSEKSDKNFDKMISEMRENSEKSDKNFDKVISEIKENNIEIKELIKVLANKT